MKSKLSKIFIAIAMLLTFIAVPKAEIKAYDGEEITPYSVTVPVNASKYHYLVSSNSTPYVKVSLTGTMVRGADKNVTSYNLNLTADPEDGNGYTIISVIFDSKSYAKNGTGVTGTYTIEVNYRKTGGAVYQKYYTHTISCGV